MTAPMRIDQNTDQAFETRIKSVQQPAIDPRVLLGVDASLFRCLRKLGTSRERICAALLLSYDEYDYVSELL